jgi:lipoyl(octanoyl) transferase
LTGEVPVIDSDRGGQITYHGPGQLVVYLLLDLRRLGLGIRDLVSLIEQIVIGLLGEYAVEATNKPGAPGVYVSGSKVAAIGFRIHRGCCYHGLSLNVDMDLSPFKSIDPCGYTGLQVTQLRELGLTVSFARVRQQLLDRFIAELSYSQIVSGGTKLPVLAVHPPASHEVS